MRILSTLVIFLLFVTNGYSDPKKPKPKKCTTYSCTDWDWKHGKGLFDPHTIHWPLHYTGEIYKDVVDGGDYHIEVAFTHGYKKVRMPLAKYRGSKYHKDPWFLDEGIKMHDAFVCEAYTHDEPHYKAGNCAQIFATHEDKYLSNDGSSCGKIKRDWTIVDWCKWEPNGVSNTKQERYVLVKDLDLHKVYFSYGKGYHDIEHDGWYTFTQVVKILDEDPPEVADCSDIVIELEDACSTKVKLKNKVFDTGECPSKTIEVEIELVNKKKSDKVIRSKWLKAKSNEDIWLDFGYLEAGDYHIKWHLNDGCGNKNACHQNLKIVDKNPPHIICLSDLSSSISDARHGMTIWAKDFVHKVQGPCHDYNLTYSFYPDTVVGSLTFDCPDGIGINELEVYVAGTNGVQASCNVTMFIADHAACDPDNMQIAGFVTDRFDNPLVGASVIIENEGVVIESDFSNERGIYGATIAKEGRPTISASYNQEEDKAKGIDAYDMILILRHIMEIERLPDAMAQAAADVDSDGDIDLDDYWAVAEVIYDIPGFELEYEEWKFRNARFRSNDGWRPSQLVAPVKITRSLTQYSFRGFKTGDVDFSWRPGSTANGRSAGARSNYVTDFDVETTSFSIDVPAGVTVTSARLNLAQSGKIHSVQLAGEDLPFVVQQIEGVPTLTILSTRDMSGESLVISASNEVLLSEQGLLFEQQGPDGYATDWSLELQASLSQTSGISVYPNPFSERVNIAFHAATNSEGDVTVYDLLGRQISTQKVALTAGDNVIELSGESFAKGLHIVVLDIDGATYTRRIVRN